MYSTGPQPLKRCGGQSPEPPDIDLIGIYERPEWQDFLKDIEKKIPDPVIRDEYMNTRGERLALECYILWTFDAGWAHATLRMWRRKYSMRTLLGS